MSILCQEGQIDFWCHRWLLKASFKDGQLCIRKKGFGPGETQVALGNFYSPKEYLALWATLGFFGFLWMSLVIFGCLWESLGVFGSLWKSLEVFGSLWKSLEVFGSLWKSLEVFGSLWESLEVFGCLWNNYNSLHLSRYLSHCYISLEGLRCKRGDS